MQLRNLLTVVAFASAGPAAAAIALVGNGPHGDAIAYVAPRVDTLSIDTVVLGRLFASARETDHSFAATGRKIRIRYKSNPVRVASLAPEAGVLEPEQRSGSVSDLSTLPSLKPRPAVLPVTQVVSVAPVTSPLVLQDIAEIAPPIRKPRDAVADFWKEPDPVTRIASVAPVSAPVFNPVVAPAVVPVVLKDAAEIAAPSPKPRNTAADLVEQSATLKLASLAPLVVPGFVRTEPAVTAPIATVELTNTPDVADSLRNAADRLDATLPEPKFPTSTKFPASTKRQAAYPELAQRHPSVETTQPVRTASLSVARSQLPMPMPTMPMLTPPVLPDEMDTENYIPWAVRQEQAKGFRAGPVHGNPHLVPHEAPFLSDHKAGTVVVHVKEKRLYLVQSPTTARVYPIGTAKGGLDILGQTRITTRRFMPTWTPTPNQRRRDPTLPRRVEAGPNNPLGIRAMGIGWRYRLIHGTSDPASIGFARSDGCIRMLNDDVADLFNRVRVGNRVLVLASANAPLTEWRPEGYQEYKRKRRKWRRKAWRKKRWKSRKRYASRRGKRRRRR